MNNTSTVFSNLS